MSFFTLREKCSCSEFFWSVFSRIWTEYISTNAGNTDQKNCKYGYFSHNEPLVDYDGIIYMVLNHAHSLKTLFNNNSNFNTQKNL